MDEFLFNYYHYAFQLFHPLVEVPSYFTMPYTTGYTQFISTCTFSCLSVVPTTYVTPSVQVYQTVTSTAPTELNTAIQTVQQQVE